MCVVWRWHRNRCCSLDGRDSHGFRRRRLFRLWWRCCFLPIEFRHKVCVITIELLRILRWRLWGSRLGTIPRGMRRITANRTFHRQFLFVVAAAETLGTLKGTMSLLRTNLTKLLLLEGSVQQGQFPQLRLFMNVLFVINHNQHLANHIGGGIDTLLVLSRNDHMKGFVIAVHDLAVAASPGALLDTPLAANSDFAARLGFQLFLCLSAGANDEADKVVVGVLFDRNWNFDGAFSSKQGVVFCGGVHVHEFF